MKLILALAFMFSSSAMGWEAIPVQSGSRDGWNIDVLDEDIFPTDPSIRIDSQGYPHLAYIRMDMTSRIKAVCYAHFNGYCWEYSTVHAGFDFKHCFLALHDGVPYVAFQIESYDYSLSLATPGSGGWDIETFLVSPDYGVLYGLEMDSSGLPHLIYCNGKVGIAEKDLNHIYYNGSSWIDDGNGMAS